MKNIRYYNVFFPIWLVLFLPGTLIFFLSLLMNALMDSGVLALACRSVRRPFKETWKKCFWKIYAIGYLVDVAGAAILLLLSMRLEDPLIYALLFNPFSHFAALLIAALATAVCGVGIVWLNFRFSFRKLDWSAAEKKKAALILGIGTAPYLFLFPSIFLYQ